MNSLSKSHIKYQPSKSRNCYSKNNNLIFSCRNSLFKIQEKNKGDGLELLKTINTNIVSVVFFDPQYRGVLEKLKYGNEGKRQRQRSLLPQMSEEIISTFITEISRVLKKSGHLFLWIDKFHFCEGINDWIKITDLKIVDIIVWDKQRIGMGYRTRRISEYLLILQKPPLRAKDVWKIKNIPDVWKEKIIKKQHPHQKPIQLQTELLKAVSNAGDIIVDPAAGSFSILEICKSLKRIFLGTDLR